MGITAFAIRSLLSPSPGLRNLQLSSMLSKPDFHLEPCHAAETVKIIVSFSFMKFTANQLLILTNLEFFNSSTILLNLIITPSHSDQSFSMMVEVNLGDPPFIISDNDFNMGDLFCWV